MDDLDAFLDSNSESSPSPEVPSQEPNKSFDDNDLHIDLSKLAWIQKLHGTELPDESDDDSHGDGMDVDMEEIIAEQEQHDQVDEDIAIADSDEVDFESSESKNMKVDKVPKEPQRTTGKRKRGNEIEMEGHDKYFLVPWDIQLPSVVRHQKHRKISYTAFRNTSTNKLLHHLRATNIPLSWIRSQVNDLFSVFGNIKTVVSIATFGSDENDVSLFGKKTNSTSDKGSYTKELQQLDKRFPIERIENGFWICFKSEQPILRALNFECESVVQQKIVGRKPLGLQKYLREYCASRPENLNELRKKVDKFMFEYDKLQVKRREHWRAKNIRRRGFVRIRQGGGWQKVHYPSSFKRRKSKPTVIRNGGNVDTVNAPGQPKMFDRHRSRRYHRQTRANARSDVRSGLVILKRGKSRVELRNRQLKKHQERWEQDMSKTTKIRRNRKSLR